MNSARLTPAIAAPIDCETSPREYQNIAAAAQHARCASAARGIKVDGTALDQEFDPEEPVSFHLGLAYFLRMQKRILELLPTVFPGLGDDHAFTTAMATFTSLEEKTWWVMERKCKQQIKDFCGE